jgi:hypothetical protein
MCYVTLQKESAVNDDILMHSKLVVSYYIRSSNQLLADSILL